MGASLTDLWEFGKEELAEKRDAALVAVCLTPDRWNVESSVHKKDPKGRIFIPFGAVEINDSVKCVELYFFAAKDSTLRAMHEAVSQAMTKRAARHYDARAFIYPQYWMYADTKKHTPRTASIDDIVFNQKLNRFEVLLGNGHE